MNKNLKENEFLVTDEDKADNKQLNKENENNTKLNKENVENIILQNEQLINKQNTENTSSNKEISLKLNKSINLNIEEPNEEKKSKEDNIEINLDIKKETNDNNNNIQINNENIIIKKESNYITKNCYNKRIFEIINKIRTNPSEYSKFILDNISYIKTENQEILNPVTGMKEYKQIIVFKKKLKVKLYKGESSFLGAAKLLQKLAPMEPLEFKEDIIIPIPETKEQINIDFIKTKAINSNIKAFFKGHVRNPEIAVLMMIVDDTESSEKKKRNSILNKDFRYIGIDSKFIGKNFIAHFSFS